MKAKTFLWYSYPAPRYGTPLHGNTRPYWAAPCPAGCEIPEEALFTHREKDEVEMWILKRIEADKAPKKKAADRRTKELF